MAVLKAEAISISDMSVSSALVRRLVRARNDPAKERIRAWFSEMDDARLLDFGLTAADIAALREPVER
ncbi:hypothetical protein [Rhizobium sp. BK251]|uniref:hypothetical protein n=1 Tax=Rhizobium sp. BK251 TaxID=2512125 RepID=UPI00104B3A3A|nr:hypothetical protein [Rhizobium sp. BK251]